MSPTRKHLQRDGPSFAITSILEKTTTEYRIHGNFLMPKRNKDSTNRTTSRTGHWKGGDARYDQTKPTATPDTGNYHAQPPPDSNLTHTIISRTPPSSLWEGYNPDQSDAKLAFQVNGWSTSIMPRDRNYITNFRERTKPDTKDVLITEHPWDYRIRKIRNLAQGTWSPL